MEYKVSVHAMARRPPGPYVEDHDHKKQQCTDAPGDKPVSRHLNDDAAAQKLNGNIWDSSGRPSAGWPAMSRGRE